MSSRLIIPVSVVLLLSVVFVPRVWARQALENPPPDSFQSGIGVISGWACAAQEIEISFNGGPRLKAAVGTIREDTQGVCGDTNNGFGLLYNWNRLGDGAHTVAAYADGEEFASVQVIVTTLGEEFLRGASGSFPLSDFPTPGETRTLRWQQAQQNFVITTGNPQGGGTSGAAPHVLENPQPGSFQSGVGVISGWACEAQAIEVSFDGGPRIQAGTGTIREDTQGVCGDTNNGFGLLYNWNRLGDGVHTVTAYADGVEFAEVTVTVTTLGAEFRRGLSREVNIPDFPEVGTDAVLQWQEARQNFVISVALPTWRLGQVRSDIILPPGVQIPNIKASSILSETTEVRQSHDPTLLLAEDDAGLVLLALANMDGGLLGEERGEVEVSLESTAVTLVGLAAGIAVSDMHSRLASFIQDHQQYGDLVSHLGTRLRADKNFLDRLYDDPESEHLIEAVAADLTPLADAPPQSTVLAAPPIREGSQWGALADAQVLEALAQTEVADSECEPGESITGREDPSLRSDTKEFFFDMADKLGFPIGDTLGTVENAWKDLLTLPEHVGLVKALGDCESALEEQWYKENPQRTDPFQIKPVYAPGYAPGRLIPISFQLTPFLQENAYHQPEVPSFRLPCLQQHPPPLPIHPYRRRLVPWQR